MRLIRRISPDRFGIIMILLAASFWGTAALSVKLLLKNANFDGFAIGFYRLALASPVLALLSWTFRDKQNVIRPGRGTLSLVLVGLFLAASHVSYYQAIRYVGVSVAALVCFSTMPLMVTFISWAGGNERLTLRLALALGLAVVGGVLLFAGPQPSQGPGAMVAGVGLALVAALTLALVILIGRRSASGYAPLFSAALTIAAASLALLPVVCYRGLAVPSDVQGWLLIAYMVSIPTVVAYILYFSGLKRVRASTASVLSLGEPLTAILLANLVFGEQLGLAGWLGAVLLLGSFVMLVRAN